VSIAVPTRQAVPAARSCSMASASVHRRWREGDRAGSPKSAGSALRTGFQEQDPAIDAALAQHRQRLGQRRQRRAASIDADRDARVPVRLQRSDDFEEERRREMSTQ